MFKKLFLCTLIQLAVRYNSSKHVNILLRCFDPGPYNSYYNRNRLKHIFLQFKIEKRNEECVEETTTRSKSIGTGAKMLQG